MQSAIKMKSNPKVSILIVHNNGEDILDACLKSIVKTDYSNFDVLLLLNSTEDNSGKVAEKYPIKIFRSRKNLGFAGGHNFLMKKTKADYIVVANNDIEVKKDWLANLVSFSEKNNVDICQPKVLSLRQRTKFEHAGAAGGFIDKYGYAFCRGRIFENLEDDKGQYDDARRIFWACGSCMMMKSSVLKDIGGFDEDFFMYSEELDLCWRANIAGYKIYSIPSAVIYHLGGYSVKKENMFAKKEYLLHRNTFLTFIKNYSGKNLSKLLLKRIILEVASAIAFPRKIIPVVKSFFWIATHLETVKKKHEAAQKMRRISDSEASSTMLKTSIAYLFFVKNKKTFKQIEEYF